MPTEPTLPELREQQRLLQIQIAEASLPQMRTYRDALADTTLIAKLQAVVDATVTTGGENDLDDETKARALAFQKIRVDLLNIANQQIDRWEKITAPATP